MQLDPKVAAEVYACFNNPLGPKKLPSDRVLIKAHKNNKIYGNTVPQLGTQQKELEPLLVPREEDQHEMEFMHETGFTREQAARKRMISQSLKLLLYHTCMENFLSLTRRRSV